MAENEKKEKKEKKKGGSVSIVAIILLLLLIILLILLFMFDGFGLFGGGSGGGVVGGRSGDAVPANADVQVTEEVKGPETTTASTSETTETQANVSEYRIEVKEDKIFINGEECPDTDTLTSRIKESYSDDNTYILVDDYAIDETYSSVKKALESENINFSEEIASSGESETAAE